ncbi:flavodoxin [Streptomyces sp. ActVer]|uniref:flavodoxin n=1 Tax=Streptomyces sp. ActVer TaxID=3014558 RepID=UPI0022B49D27|nr:flavodoxin [Streptomyces sp. ActVer]MCZ4513889.1 flavodoxin [Streptomyces sp. ActVer]
MSRKHYGMDVLTTDEGGPDRRKLLRAVLLGGATAMTGAQITACSTPTPPEPTAERPATRAAPGERGRILLAYFSRPGENYSYGGRTTLDIGNTEVLAGMIGDRVECDVHRIEAVDPYPENYDETVARNAREQKADARPSIANPLSSTARYDTILLGSPIWNVRAPMIMSTFAERLDFRGKTVFPFTTHAMSGLGTTERDYAASCRGATIGEGLAVRGEEVRQADTEVRSWLRRIGALGTAREPSTQPSPRPS